MTVQIEKQFLPTDEESGKRYIDPESTQVFIEALIKLKQDDTDCVPETSDTETSITETFND